MCRLCRCVHMCRCGHVCVDVYVCVDEHREQNLNFLVL